MALPPIATATIQSTVLAAISNFLAQFFRSYRLDVRKSSTWTIHGSTLSTLSLWLGSLLKQWEA